MSRLTPMTQLWGRSFGTRSFSTSHHRWVTQTRPLQVTHSPSLEKLVHEYQNLRTLKDSLRHQFKECRDIDAETPEDWSYRQERHNYLKDQQQKLDRKVTRFQNKVSHEWAELWEQEGRPQLGLTTSEEAWEELQLSMR